MGGKFSINTVDLYSEPVHFSFKNKTYFKTVCGGFVSLVELILLILYIIYLIDDITSQNHPIIIDSQIINDIPGSLNFIKDPNFTNPDALYQPSTVDLTQYHGFGLKLNSVSGNYVFLDNNNRKFIDLTIEEVSIVNSTTSKRQVNFEPCKKFANFKTDFVNLGLKGLYCINDNFELKGHYNMENSKSLYIKLKKCNADTEKKYKITCSRPEDIDNYIKTLQFEWYYEYNLMNITNVDNVKALNLEQKYWDIISTFSKSSKIPFAIDRVKMFNSVIPDFLAGGYKTEYIISMGDFNTEIYDLESDDTLLKIIWISSDTEIIHERRYASIFSLLATFGGMCDIIYFVGAIFVWKFAKEKFNEELINTFYTLIDPDCAEENKNPSKYNFKNNNNVSEFDTFIALAYNLHQERALTQFYKKYIAGSKNNAFYSDAAKEKITEKEHPSKK